MLSIIIPARNAPEITQRSILTAQQSLDYLRLSAEFILIDDASDSADGILPLFREYQKNAGSHQVIVARAKRHQHYTGVFSIGLSLSEGDRILFLSNDMMVTPSFLTGLLGVAALSEDFGIVRGTSNHTDSHPEHTVPAPGNARHYEDLRTFSRAILELNGLSFTEDRLLSGDAVLLSRRLVERIGVLDLRFFGYFGDIDYGIRARRAGFKLVCAKGAWLFHEGYGHVKAEAARNREDMQQAHARRMLLVQNAYAAFRAKWLLDLPAEYTPTRLADYVSAAEASSAPVELRYDLSLRAMDDVVIER